MAHTSNPIVHLVSGQVTAFARLGSLGHLDLQLDGVGQVVRCHAKTSRSNLLDRAAFTVAIGLRGIADGVLTAFTRIRLAPDAVHGYGQRAMGFMRDGTEAHGTCGEARQDALDTF